MRQTHIEIQNLKAKIQYYEQRYGKIELEQQQQQQQSSTVTVTTQNSSKKRGTG